MVVSPLEMLPEDSPVMTYGRVPTGQTERPEGMGFVEGFTGQQKQNLIPKAWEYITRDSYAPDPNWVNPALDDKRIPIGYRSNFVGVASQEEYDATYNRLKDELDWQQRVATASGSGKAGAIISGFLDPALLVAAPVEEVAIGGKILQMGRLARMARGAAVLGTSAAATEAALVGVSETKPWEDVLTAAAAGCLFGGGFGAFKKTSKLLMSNKSIAQADEAARASAARNGYLSEIFSEEFTAEAQALATKNARKRTLKNSLKWSMGERGRMSPSGVFASTMRRLTDNSGSGGKYTRHHTAAVERELNHRMMASQYADFWSNYQQWSKNQGYGISDQFLHGEGRVKFGRAVMEELEYRARHNVARNTDPNIEAVIKMNGDFNKVELGALKHAGVEGAEAIEDNAFHFHRQWQFEKIAQNSDTFKKLITRSLMQTHEGILEKDAERIAKKIYNRMESRFNSKVDASLARYEEDHLDALEEALEDILDSPGTLDEVMQVIVPTGTSKSKAPGYLKRKMNLDMSVSDDSGMSLWDFIDTDLGQSFSNRAAQSSGRAALARQGIRSDADWDKLRRLGFAEASANPARAKDIEKDWERLVVVKRQLLGQATYDNPNSSLNRVARDLMDLTHLSTMGQMGIAQATELANLAGENGLVNVIKAMPQMKRMEKAIKNNPELAADFNAMSWAVAKDHKMMVPGLRTDEGRLLTSDDGALLTGFRNSLQEGKRLLNYMSLQNNVLTTERNLWLHSTYIRFFDHANGKRAISTKRLNDMGISPDLNNKMILEIRKHGGKFENEGIKSLGMNKWDGDTLREFQLVMSRQMNQAIQGNLAGEVPKWATSSFGRVLAQFRNFPLVAFTKQTKRQMKMMDPQAFQTISYGAMLSMAVHYGRTHLNAATMDGRKRREYLDKNLSTAGLAHGTLRYLPVASVAPDGVNMVANLMGLDVGQPYRGGVSVASNMSIGSFAAGGGYLENTVKAARGIKNAATGDYNEHDARAMMSILPFANVLGIRQAAGVVADTFK